MTYGEHPLLPWVQGPAKQTYSESDIASKFRLLQFAHTIVNQNNLASKQASKRQYDKLAKERVFKIGDQVLVHYNDPLPGQNRKLFRQWRGPFFVMQSLDLLRKWVDLVTLLYQFGELWFCSPFKDALDLKSS